MGIELSPINKVYRMCTLSLLCMHSCNELFLFLSQNKLIRIMIMAMDPATGYICIPNLHESFIFKQTSLAYTV
jgi:hypothetical protein